MKLDQFVKQAIVDVANGIKEANDELSENIKFRIYGDHSSIYSLEFSVAVDLNESTEITVVGDRNTQDHENRKTLNFKVPFMICEDPLRKQLI